MYSGEVPTKDTPDAPDASSCYHYDADPWPPDIASRGLGPTPPCSPPPPLLQSQALLDLLQPDAFQFPFDHNVLWSSGPSSIGEKDSLGGLVSHTDVMSASVNPPPRRSHQLGTKVEMVYSLLSLLGSHDREDMSKTLLAMSASKESCIAMRQSGCLPLLVQLLHGEEAAVREARRHAGRALHNIVHAHPDDKRGRREARVLRLLEQIRDYCDYLRDGCPQEAEQQHPGPAIAALMKLSFDEEHRHAMCQLGGLQAIAELVQASHEVAPTAGDHALRRYAGMALTNLTFGDGTNKAMLCAMKPFMRALVAQLHSPNEDLRQVTASVLRNLSWRADAASKHTLREVGAVTTLTQAAMQATKEPILKSILSALWNLSAHCTANKADICAVEGALPFLVSTLTYKSPSKTLAIVENGGGILRNISSHIAVREDYRMILRQHNCLQILLQHLKSPSLTVVSNTCGTLWNLSARSPIDQQALWEMGAVGMLRNLVHSKHKMISMGSSAALRNLLSYKPTSLENPRTSLLTPSMPSLTARKQKALEAELDPSLSETCDNLDSPKTSPTPQPAEGQFSFMGLPHIIPYLPGRMYRSVNGSVPRSDSKDSIGSTHSEPLYYGFRSYHMFSKNLRYLAYEKKHPVDCCKSYFCRNSHQPSDPKDISAMIPERLVEQPSQSQEHNKASRHSYPQSKDTSWPDTSALQLRKDFTTTEREGVPQEEGCRLLNYEHGSSHGDFSQRTSDAMISPPRPAWPVLEEEEEDPAPASSPEEASPESGGQESDEDEPPVTASGGKFRSRLPHLAVGSAESARLVQEQARSILSEVNQRLQRPPPRSTHTCGFSHGPTPHHSKDRPGYKCEPTKVEVSHFVPCFPAPAIRPQSLQLSRTSPPCRVQQKLPAAVASAPEDEEKGKEDERAHEKPHASPLLDKELPTEIQLEAKMMAAKMEAVDVDDELTFSSMSDIDNMKPPSVMGDIASITNLEMNGTLHKPSKKLRHNGNGHRALPGGLRRVLACNKELNVGNEFSDGHLAANVESYENGSISDILENVNPPSAMDEVSIAGSYTSDSISSDILESHSYNEASNVKPQVNGNSEMFERFNAAAAMVQVYSRELNNIMTGSMKSSGNSEIIDHVKPPSVFHDITEVTVEDKTELATDAMASDIDEELPHDDMWPNLPKLRSLRASGRANKPTGSKQTPTPLTSIVNTSKFMTAQKAMDIEENANIIVSTINQANHNDIPGDMLEDEILSLVSAESEDDPFKNSPNLNFQKQNTPPTPRRGPRIVKPINKETIRQMQEKKNAENFAKSNRNSQAASRSTPHQLVKSNSVASCRTTNLVKPTKTSALRASQNQKMQAAAASPVKPPARQSSFARSDSTSRMISKPLQRSLTNKENVSQNGFSQKKEESYRPRPPLKQGTYTKLSRDPEGDDTASGTSDSRTSTPSASSRGSVVRPGQPRSVHSSPGGPVDLVRKQGAYFRKEVPSKIASLWKKSSGNSSDPEKSINKPQSSVSRSSTYEKLAATPSVRPSTLSSAASADEPSLPFGYKTPSRIPSPSKPVSPCLISMV